MQQRSGVGGNNDVEMMRPSTKSKKKIERKKPKKKKEGENEIDRTGSST